MKHLLAIQPNELVYSTRRSYDGIENVLVITDTFTKWTKTIPTRDQIAKTVAKALVKELFYHQGVPKRLYSGQGRNLRAKLFKSYAPCMKVISQGLLLTICRGIMSVRDTTEPCITYLEHWKQIRKGNSLSIYTHSHSIIMSHHMQALVTHPIFWCRRYNLD